MLSATNTETAEPPSLDDPPTAQTSRDRPDHGTLSWTACYDDRCTVHKSEKDGAGWYPTKPRKQKHPITTTVTGITSTQAGGNAPTRTVPHTDPLRRRSEER